METDSVVAIVTPPGQGGVGIVRVSGPLARDLAPCLFPGLSAAWPSHRMRLGQVIDPQRDEAVDQALGCLMLGPHSYTGEDVLEIHCHGSPLVLQRIVGICVRQGCRQARPGEFTLRAFLNGRMDLSQAEAVLDVVQATSNLGLGLAVRQLEGWLSQRVEPVRQQLVSALAHMEAMVDFVEDDIPPPADARTIQVLELAHHAICDLLSGAEQGIVLREGISLAIVGSPNVGKSSLMNALLGLERSIVTPVAGTTRDTVEEAAHIGGVSFRLVDTAGIIDTEDIVERIGVERARLALANADLVLLVLDRSRPVFEGDRALMDALREARGGAGRKPVIALNKCDLPGRAELSSSLTDLEPHAVIETSALDGAGIEALRESLVGAALGETRHEFTVGNVRHQEALRAAAGALQDAMHGMERGTPLDLVSFDVRAAAQSLGEITGANVDDELLDRIFQDFCIGK